MRGENCWYDMLEASGAIRTGHFRLSSGQHSGMYIQCAKVLEDPARGEALGAALAREMQCDADRVISPPLGGILIGYEVARALGKPFLFPERGADGRLCLRRGFSLEPGERVCIVEDVVTTGKTTLELLDLLERSEVTTVSTGAIVDRSTTRTVKGMPIHALLRLSIPTFDPEDCPHCGRGETLQSPGSRHRQSVRPPSPVASA